MASSSSVTRDGWFDRLIDILAIISGVILCALTLLICLDVVARYFLLFTMPWSLDMAEWALLLVTFLGAPWVLVEGGHIAIDILVERLSDRAKRRMTLLSYAVGAVVCTVLLVFSIRAGWNSFSQGTTVHETFVYPEWILFTIPPPVFLMMIVIFVRWLLHPPEHVPGGDAAADAF